MKRFPLKQLLFVAFTLFLLNSCKKFEDLKIAKTAWNPNLAVPIGFASFGVYDILATQDSNDLIVIDAVSGAIALNYSSEIFSVSASQVANLSSNLSQSFTQNVSDLGLPGVSVGFNGNSTTTRTEILPLAMSNGEEINSIFFKSGVLDLHFETDLRHDVSVTLTFLDFIQNSAPITRSFNMVFSGSVPQTQDLQIDLAETLADFTNNGTSVNETRVELQVAVLGTGQPITGTEDLTMDITSANLDFHNVKGYLGQQSVAQVADSVLLRVFQNATAGTFELTNPKITFTIDNSFGIPIDVNLANLKSINVNTGQTLDLTGYPTPIHATAPAVIGQHAITSFELNTSNTTNLSSVISPTPKYFYYEVDAETNPNGNLGIENFVDENSSCIIKTDVDMPLEGFAYGFNIADTVDFTQFNSTNTDLIDFVMFRIIVDNGFPVMLGTQITAVDENFNVLFSIFNQPENIVEGAPVDATGKVTSEVRKISDIVLDQSQIDLLSQTKKIIIYGEASTTDSDINKVVKFYDSYKIGIKLALQIQLQTEL